jgi:hypothetical protein
MYGCEFENDMPERWQVRDYIWRRCPLKLITQETNNALVAYSFLKKGLMPYMNGYRLNSKRYLMAMQVIEAEINSIEARNMRQAKK